jgi:hypothetical protein
MRQIRKNGGSYGKDLSPLNCLRNYNVEIIRYVGYLANNNV